MESSYTEELRIRGDGVIKRLIAAEALPGIGWPYEAGAEPPPLPTITVTEETPTQTPTQTKTTQ